jgi:hypothetical protein
MNIVNGITADAAQTIAIVLPDGSAVTLTLYFRPAQHGWFFDMAWPGSSAAATPFTSLGRRLVASANLLHQFKDLVPFGIACFSVDGLDPSSLTAFTDGTANIVLLGSDDVASIEAQIFTP